MAKIESGLLATSIEKILAFSKGEEVDGKKGKVRGFTETIELQVSLRNYDPQKDKRFTGAFRLPVAPRPTLSVCVLGSEVHCSGARAMGVDAMVRAMPRARGAGWREVQAECCARTSAVRAVHAAAHLERRAPSASRTCNTMPAVFWALACVCSGSLYTLRRST